ncbi:hypothetical protein CJU89_4895 [Yarrowia sp. B02]|nr:hypothetical protein CJU89_4895 [Yarrowia sp. B02]
MHDAITNLGLFKPGTDYYGRDYGALAYHDFDVYDYPYESFSVNGPGPYPSHAYEGVDETNPFMGLGFDGSLDEPHLDSNAGSAFGSSFESSTLGTSLGSNPRTHHFSQSTDSLLSDYQSSQNTYSHLPTYLEPQYVPNSTLESTPELPHLEPASPSSPSDVEYQPPTPQSSQESGLTLAEFAAILPRDVALAQKPHSEPLLPTDPQSAVAQLHACPQMWEKACHAKKGVFICTNCHHNCKPLSFRTMIELAVHFDSHGLMRKSKCEKPSCPWSVVGFSTRSEKNRHTKSQHSDLAFPCQTCGRLFGRCDSLKRHMKLVHSVLPPKKVVKKKTKKEVPSSPVSEPEETLRWTNPQNYYSFVTKQWPNPS